MYLKINKLYLLKCYSLLICFCILLSNSTIFAKDENSIYRFNYDNIYDDIRMNAAFMDMSFDLEANIVKKPLLLIVTLRNCDNCNNIINNINDLYPKYIGLFYPVLVLANWEEVTYYRNKYGNQFIYIPLIFTSMKNIKNIPYIVITNRQGIILEAYAKNLNRNEIDILINKIIKY